jgi:RNA polymerase sigma-70 factor (ECF subfamily)
MRRLGVPEASLEDAAQDVFLVVHRRLSEFEGRSSLRTWIFGIVLRVAARHRRKARGIAVREAPIPGELGEALTAPLHEGPFECAVLRQANRLLHQVLERLDDERRALLIMVDLEQTSVAEAAEALELNLNTAYSRLRAARRSFETELAALLGGGEALVLQRLPSTSTTPPSADTSVSTQARAALAQQLAQDRAVATPLVLAVAADREVRTLGERR